MVCMKIIENNKDYFDQSVDEIKLLRFINSNCENLDDKYLLKLFDYFYHKEHLFIVTELLRDNLYEYGKYNREVEKKQYFNDAYLDSYSKYLVAAWKLDEMSGTRYDSAGFNQLTDNGGVTYTQDAIMGRVATFNGSTNLYIPPNSGLVWSNSRPSQQNRVRIQIPVLKCKLVKFRNNYAKR